MFSQSYILKMKEGTATRDISLTQKGNRHMTSQDQSTGKVAPG